MRILQIPLLLIALVIRACFGGPTMHPHAPGRYHPAPELLTPARYLELALEAEAEHNALRAQFLAGRLVGYSSFVDVTDEEYPPMLDVNATEYQEALEILARNQSELAWASPMDVKQDMEGLEYRLTWSPVGDYIAAYFPIYYGIGPDEYRALEQGLGRDVRVYDVGSGSVVQSLEFPAGFVVMGVAWSPDGSRMAVAGRTGVDEKIVIRDVWGDAGPIELRGDARFVWSHDGAFIVSWSRNKVSLWNSASGDLVRVVMEDANLNAIGSVSLSPDNTQISISCHSYEDPCEASIWNLETGEQLYAFPGERVAKWNRDGTQILTWGYYLPNDRLNVRDACTGEVIETSSEVSSLPGALFSPDGTLVAFMDMGKIEMHTAESGEVLYETEWNREQDRSMQWSPDGRYLITETEYGSVRIRDAETGDLLYESDNRGIESSEPLCNQDGTKVAFWNGGEITILDLEQGFPMALENGHLGSIRKAIWSSDQTEIISVGLDESVCYWDADTGTLLDTFQIGTEWAEPNPQGMYIAVKGEGTRVLVYDAQSKAVVHTLNHPIRGLERACWSPDGSRLAVFGGDGKVYVWDAGSGVLLQTLDDHSSGGGYGEWSPDGSLLAVDYGSFLDVWDVESGELASKVRDERLIAFMDSERMLTTIGRYDSPINVRSIRDGSLLTSFQGDNASYDPNLNIIVVGVLNYGLNVLDAVSYQVINTYNIRTALSNVLFSNDGNLFAVYDKPNIFIYDALSGELVRTLEAPTWVPDVEWSPDGTRILSARNGLYVWDLSGNDLGRFSPDIMRFASFDGRGLSFQVPLGNIGEVLTITRQ